MSATLVPQRRYQYLTFPPPDIHKKAIIRPSSPKIKPPSFSFLGLISLHGCRRHIRW